MEKYPSAIVTGCRDRQVFKFLTTTHLLVFFLCGNRIRTNARTE